MQAGKLKERLRFEAKYAVADGHGNYESENWRKKFTVNARVMPLRGSEAVIAQRLAGVQPVIITVWRSRRTREITTGWRAVDTRTGTLYNVRSIADMKEKGLEFDIIAESGVASG